MNTPVQQPTAHKKPTTGPTGFQRLLPGI